VFAVIPIEELIAATKRQKRLSDKSVGWPLAAIKAIESKGIRYKPDINRLKRAVLRALHAEGVVHGRLGLR
jgi:hypothetical protein